MPLPPEPPDEDRTLLVDPVEFRKWLEGARDAKLLPPSVVVGPDRERQIAKQILASLPPHGEVAWHGTNGRPCPCLTCSRGWTRFLDANGLIKLPTEFHKRAG